MLLIQSYWDFKYLPIITAFDKLLCNKAFQIAKNPKSDGYQRGQNFMIKILQLLIQEQELTLM